MEPQIPDHSPAAEELQRYRTFFNDGPVVVFRWRAEAGWPVEYVSPNVLQLFGVSAADFVSGRVPYARTVHPDDLARVAAEVATHTASGRAGFDQQYRIVRPGGEVRWLFDHTLVHRDGSGAVTHYEGYVLDQTAAVLSRHEHEEMQRIIQQTQKLESLGVLAGGIAHDFNNLLTVIAANTEFALQSLPPEHPASTALHDSLRSAERAADLTRQMLAYAGRSSLERRVLDLGTMAHEISDLLAASLSKKVRVHLDVDASLPPVEADPAQMQQVIMNLVLNAAEAYGSRSGTVQVGTRRASADELRDLQDVGPRGAVVLEVRDEGSGMTAATSKRIFEPFFTTKAQGRGLGLSAVLGILRAHGGTIALDSVPGVGTTMRVVLPASHRALEPSQGTSLPSTANGHGRVLVVDDEEAVLRVAVRILRACGYETLTASDGRAAVELFREQAQTIDFVLLDWTMAEMNGDEALQAMRRIRPDVRAALTSGYHEPGALLPGLDRPTVFLKKPYTIESLTRALHLLQSER